MPRIFELAPHVADLIAAGEVVERPGSVVKELIENAIDAGATAVTVEIKNGGMSYIRVTDNGCGILREDAATAFLRHATSKLREGADLEAIGTLGFRGEALAAIAAVSRVELITRAAEEDEGTRLILTGGVVEDQLPAGCPQGTTIIVRDLFFNTPARRKYMKKDSAEGAAAANVAARAALANPGVSVRFIRDGKEELHTPGDGKLDSCIYSVFGRDFALKLMHIDGGTENVRVTGFITEPTAARGNRGQQHFFLNGRHIKSAIIQAALEQGYKNCVMTGKFPGCVLHITMRPQAVDVNVHPAKTEVRFAAEREVFDAVYYTVKSALEAGAQPPVVSRPRPDETPTRMSAQEYREMMGVKKAPAPAQQSFIPRAPHSYVPQKPPAEIKVADGGKTAYTVTPTPKPQPMPEPAPTEAPRPAPAPEPVPEPELNVPDWRFVGEAMDTYIIVESEAAVIFIDKHAVHERILFDRIKSEKREIMSQQLIAPVMVTVGREEAVQLTSNVELMQRLGFELDDFGDGAMMLRRLPEGVMIEQAEALLCELAGRLERSMRVSEDELLGGLLESIACKAAVKAGMKSAPEELAALVEPVLSGAVRTCPHGRPVSFTLSRSQLERQFKRIV